MSLYSQSPDWTVNFSFKGNIGEAKLYRRLAEKIVARLQQQLELGANLGQSIEKSFVVDQFTIINAQLQPGVTGPIAKMEIVSAAPQREEREGKYSAAQTLCPDLPHGVEGARMFTQRFGHERGEGPFEEFAMEVEPAQDRLNYCGTQQGNVRLAYTFPDGETFNYLGESYSKFWYNNFQLGFAGPEFFNDEVPLTVGDAPCDLGVADLFRDDDFHTWVGSGRGGGCGLFGEQASDTVVIRGQIPLVSLDSISGQEIVVTRNFTAVNHTRANTSGSGFGSEEFEIVLINLVQDDRPLLGQCAAAIGFFWGGPDGQNPWQFSEWKDIPLNDLQLDVDQWFGPKFCENLGWPSLGFGNFPAGFGTYLVDENNDAVAYVNGGGSAGISQGADDGDEPDNNSALAWLNSRSFWFYLDAFGFPIEGQGSVSDGLAHLNWN